MAIAKFARTVSTLTACLLLSSCAGFTSWVRPPHCPVAPVSTAELSDVELRVRMRFTIKSEEAHLEAIARSTEGELWIVGIAAYGIRLFAIHQRGQEIQVEGATSSKFEHLALWTLDALHRSIWIQAPTNTRAGSVVSWQWENERVTESNVAGERHREFSRARASAPVRVHYSRPAAALRIEIQNPWCGYEAVVAIIDSAGGPSDE